MDISLMISLWADHYLCRRTPIFVAALKASVLEYRNRNPRLNKKHKTVTDRKSLGHFNEQRNRLQILKYRGWFCFTEHWLAETKRSNLELEELASQGLSASTRFVLSLRWLLRLDDVASEFICTYWRVSAGPRLKSSGNPREASETRLPGSRDQCLSLMKGALPIKCSARLLLMMTHP